MFLAALASLLLSMFLVIWYTPEGVFKGLDNPVYMFVSGISAGVFLANIFNFKKLLVKLIILSPIILLFI